MTTTPPTTTGTTDLAESVTRALQAIPGVTLIDVSVTGDAVSVEFTDTDDHQYEGRVAPGFREVTSEHPSAEFRSITFLEGDGAGVGDQAEQVAWLADTAARSLAAMAGVSAWQQVGAGCELPADSAFTVSHDLAGTVTAVLVVGCDGFDAEVTHTRSGGGTAAMKVTMTDDSPYVPPHLRAVVDVGLPLVVAAQAGYTVDGLARQIDAAAQAWSARRSTPRTNRA